MEPATVVLLMGIAAPFVPTKVRAITESKYSLESALPVAPETQVTAKIAGSKSASQIEKVFVPQNWRTDYPSPLDEAILKIQSIESQASIDAIQVLKVIPPGFPLPRIVHAEDDSITLFWDNEDFYADIELKGDGFLSIFTRQRGVKKIDRGNDAIPLSQPFSSWGYDYLSDLTSIHRAAA